MKSTFSTVALSVLAAVPSALAYQPGSCGETVVKQPKPSGYRCGSQVAPTGKYATRALIGQPQTNVKPEACYSACYAANACQALTFTFTDQEDGVGTCKMYKNGGGTAMRLEPTTGTFFYNRNCLTQLDCFNLKVNDPSGGQYDDQFVQLDLSDNPQRLNFVADQTVSDGSTNFYMTQKQGGLISDRVALPAKQDSSQSAGFLEFPDGGQTGFIGVSCTIAASELTCSSTEGTDFYACSGANVDGLYLASTTPTNGATCALVTLDVVAPA